MKRRMSTLRQQVPLLCVILATWTCDTKPVTEARSPEVIAEESVDPHITPADTAMPVRKELPWWWEEAHRGEDTSITCITTGEITTCD